MTHAIGIEQNLRLDPRRNGFEEKALKRADADDLRNNEIWHAVVVVLTADVADALLRWHALRKMGVGDQVKIPDPASPTGPLDRS